ncbi:hypothetical protein G210_5458 [Candida maltosa Xu316]|uniref:Uncharacterized protein n=1 Tax=Candida maltosa (strain Xu316) TaxID=1245528 RepID=M3K358_CANMX|nr:hypothetical protein G210_5458 [Candida maltosa Xu316]
MSSNPACRAACRYKKQNGGKKYLAYLTFCTPELSMRLWDKARQ